jgi:serine/threonine protein kinase
MFFWKRLFFIIGIAITSAQSVAPGQNVYRFPNAQVLANYDHSLRVMVNDGEQKAIKYVFLDSKKLQAGYPTSSEQVSIDLPRLPLGDWNEAHIHLDGHTGTHSISNTTRTSYLEMMDNWHPRKTDYLEFVKVETLQQDRLQVVTHPDFDAPVLIKIASFPWEIPSLEREATVYRLLHGSGATPEFLGYVTEGSRSIGFITEYIEEVSSVRGRNMRGCLAALRSLHQRGIAHGDAHDGNCMIRKNESSILIDFELSVETWSQEEFERDLDIMGRCIQAYSEHS